MNARAQPGAPDGDAAPTGGNLRQVVPVPGVTARLAALGLIRAAAAPAVERAVAAAVTDGYVPPARAKLTCDDQYVTYWWNAVRQSGSAETVDGRYAAMKRNPHAGRKAKLSTRTILTALLVCALAGRAMLVSELTTFLYENLSPSAARLLDVGVPASDPTRKTRAAKRLRDAQYANVRRALHRILSTIDPSIHPKNRVRSWKALTDAKRDLTVEEQQEMQTALDAVCSQLLTIPWSILPAEVRARWKGHVGIDATPAGTYSVGKSVHSIDAATDPDAAWYVRTGTHSEDEAYDQHGKRVRRVRKAVFGYDVTMLVAADDTPGDRQHFPAIPVAISLDRPGCDPAGAARRVFAQFLHQGHTPGMLAADGLYAPLNEETFHKEVFNAGFTPLFWLPERMLGHRGTVNGMVHVEGAYYSPSIPDRLVTANIDYRARKITADERDARLAERRNYLMRVHGYTTVQTLAGPRKVSTRWVCGAHGGQKAAVVACPNKPGSLTDRPVTLTPDGRRIDARLTITLTPGLAARPARPCRDATVPSGVYDKLQWRQAYPYATPAWRASYRALRQSHEGFHGYSKDDAKEAVGNATRRRIRGIAATSLLVTVLVTAAAIRKVLTFLEQAQPDEHDTLYVLRAPRKARVYPFGHADDADPPDEPDGPPPDTTKPTRKAA